jgi:hypothetical protein
VYMLSCSELSCLAKGLQITSSDKVRLSIQRSYDMTIEYRDNT